MSKNSRSREAAEKAEGLEQVKQDVPANRLQTEQQIAPAQAAESTKPVDSSFSTKKSAAKGETLKQEIISDAITGSNSPAGMGFNAAGRHVSGTAGGVLGANNSTPQADKSRSGSRIGKKLDRVATKINYTPSEQVLLAVDESKPLADASDADQGYNGTYRNEFARSQKIAGAVPGDLMFQRSVDLILKDKLYFVEGQQVFQNADDRVALNPTQSVDIATGINHPVTYHSGNYLHKKFHFGLKSTGEVKFFYADVEDLTPAAVSAEDANVASAHRLIKANVAELDRIAMDSKAGDEKADLWTCLARAIEQPTQTSYLLSSIEADVGAYCHLAYSKASTNMAYQLNRAAKDGLEIVDPAIEQCVGWRSGDGDSLTLGGHYNHNLGNVFDDDYYKLGDPSLIIAAYDSIGKYNNKADLLLQPRGWRMHLQTADNNINPLRLPREYADVFAGTEVFSTIDHDYDPILPICMTDKANLITVHNFNELAAFWKGAGYKHVNIVIQATNIEATYKNTPIMLAEQGAPAAMGWSHIYVYYLKDEGDGLVFDQSTGIITMDPDSTDDDREIDIIVSPIARADLVSDGYVLLVDKGVDFTHDVIFNAPIVQNYSGTVITKADLTTSEGPDWEYLDAGTFAYKYSDLRNNYIVEVKHPLIQGMVNWLQESIGAKIYSLGVHTLHIPMIFSTQYMTLAQIAICAATPWITRVRLNSMKDVIYYEDNLKVYPFSKLASIRDVPFKNYVNFGFTDYDSPLEARVMNPVQAINWIMPEFFWKVATEKYVLPWYMNEGELVASTGAVDDDASVMSMPSIRSGIRLAALDTLYGMSEKDIRLSLDRITRTFLRDTDIDSFGAYKYGRTTDGQILANLKADKVFSVTKILSAPRELGLVMDAPLGVLTIDPADVVSWNVPAFKSFSADGTATSYRIKLWTNTNTILHPSILSATGVNITRAANYSQKWFEITANNAVANCDIAGLVMGMGDDVALYSPFAALSDGSSLGNGVNVVSYQRSVNTRLQYLPFVISPFDGVFDTSKAATHDIYDFAYFFGLAGFRASDYRESVYNREKEVINQGITFVEDPWILASPIIKGAGASTGVKLTKGYVMK